MNEEKAGKMSGEETERVIAKEILDLTQDFETFQRPAQHFILPQFTAEEGLLTSTMKIRRHKVFEKYRKEIEELLARN